MRITALAVFALIANSASVGAQQAPTRIDVDPDYLEGNEYGQLVARDAVGQDILVGFGAAAGPAIAWLLSSDGDGNRWDPGTTLAVGAGATAISSLIAYLTPPKPGERDMYDARAHGEAYSLGFEHGYRRERRRRSLLITAVSGLLSTGALVYIASRDDQDEGPGGIVIRLSVAR